MTTVTLHPSGSKFLHFYQVPRPFHLGLKLPVRPESRIL